MAADLLEISDQSGRGRGARVTNKQGEGSRIPSVGVWI